MFTSGYCLATAKCVVHASHATSTRKQGGDVFAIVIAKAANLSEELSDKIDRTVMDEIGYPLKRVSNDICDPDPDYELKR